MLSSFSEGVKGSLKANTAPQFFFNNTLHLSSLLNTGTAPDVKNEIKTIERLYYKAPGKQTVIQYGDFFKGQEGLSSILKNPSAKAKLLALRYEPGNILHGLKNKPKCLFPKLTGEDRYISGRWQMVGCYETFVPGDTTFVIVKADEFYDFALSKGYFKWRGESGTPALNTLTSTIINLLIVYLEDAGFSRLAIALFVLGITPLLYVFFDLAIGLIDPKTRRIKLAPLSSYWNGEFVTMKVLAGYALGKLVIEKIYGSDVTMTDHYGAFTPLSATISVLVNIIANTLKKKDLTQKIIDSIQTFLVATNAGMSIGWFKYFLGLINETVEDGAIGWQIFYGVIVTVGSILLGMGLSALMEGVYKMYCDWRADRLLNPERQQLSLKDSGPDMPYSRQHRNIII